MISTGIITALAATFFWALCVFPFTKASRLMTVAGMNLVRLVSATILTFVIACVAAPGNIHILFSAAYSHAWLWLGLSGILSLGIGDYFSYRMYVILGPRYGAVLITLSPAAALLGGIELLDQHINIIGITGMLITATGIAGMSLGRTERSNIPDHGHGSIFNGIVFGIIAAVCSGYGLALSKRGFMEQAAAGHVLDPFSASFIRFVTATLVVLVTMGLNRKLYSNFVNIRSQPWKVMRIALAGVLLGPILGVSFGLTSIQYIDVAVSQTLFALIPVVTLLVSHYVYKERITKYALAGVLLAITGVVILIWRMQIEKILG